jgi:hypothetical protein
MYEYVFCKENSMKTNMTRFALLILLIASFMALIVACSDADVASNNLSKAADQFEITRRIVFYNGITDKYILTIEGLCSLGNWDVEGEVSVTCKVGTNEYKKHFLGLSDNVTYFAEQLEEAEVGVYHHRVIFKPEAILPDVDLETSK